MNPTDLERVVDKALKALPPPRAPRTLLPAVMFAVRAAALRPWYARPWFSWPRTWQAVSAAALLVLLIGGSFAAPVLQPYFMPLAAGAGVLLHPAGEVVADVETFISVVEIVRRTVAQSVIGLGLALFLMMLVTSVALGAAIGRVALGGAYRS